ncbi:DUF262 domain-containing protein [Chryseobacterium taichungense]|uniref:DUF262 domain-containing protein n=1 Tax=Chryseobacterium taichungense TaxID=295069 RepID=UPI0028ABBAF6|nr:DUF262 domain-containing protein [Chryseobacterium taichungense]
MIELNILDGTSIFVDAFKLENNHYEFKDSANVIWLKGYIENNKFVITEKNTDVNEDDGVLSSKLDKLVLDLIESEQSGTENTASALPEEHSPFNPEEIKVHAKSFSLRLISDMIDDSDIDLSPDFQRNFVWNSAQKSRLIESVLLRIPLPMFYFSEDDEGRITIVDGLQRLTTIKEFMDNKFSLRNLEYLEDSCGGKYYKNEESKIGLDPKYFRWFNQTQFSVNVIDPSSPPKVKYDIFRRINTGGKPLNNQEIRNCLATNSLRDILKEMVNLPEFKSATDKSIKPTRMDDQEIALRFILFHRFMENDNTIEEYNGYMDTSLDDLTEELSKRNFDELSNYISLFSNSMQNSEYLFGRKYAFRKVRPFDLVPTANKQLINKALFVSWSVLLSRYDHNQIRNLNPEKALLEPLAQNIFEDRDFLNFLSYGTNGRSNLLYVFDKVQEIIEENLNY